MTTSAEYIKQLLGNVENVGFFNSNWCQKQSLNDSANDLSFDQVDYQISEFQEDALVKEAFEKVWRFCVIFRAGIYMITRSRLKQL
jgi:hypothetical protein